MENDLDSFRFYIRSNIVNMASGDLSCDIWIFVLVWHGPDYKQKHNFGFNFSTFLMR